MGLLVSHTAGISPLTLTASRGVRGQPSCTVTPLLELGQVARGKVFKQGGGEGTAIEEEEAWTLVFCILVYLNVILLLVD